MTPQQKIDKIIATIKEGKTLYFSTCTRSTKVTPKTLKRWEDAGNVLFKADSKSMYMAAGNRFDCIDYCKITVEG